MLGSQSIVFTSASEEKTPNNAICLYGTVLHSSNAGCQAKIGATEVGKQEYQQ